MKALLYPYVRIYMNKIKKIRDVISSISSAPGAVLLVAWVFVFAAYIIFRLFGVVWIFVEEFTGYWLVFIAFMPLSYALFTKVHVRTDIITNRLSSRVRAILQVCTECLGLVIVSFLLMRSIEWLIQSIETNLRSDTSLNIVLWPICLFIPVGFTMFGLSLLINIVFDARALFQANKGAEPEET